MLTNYDFLVPQCCVEMEVPFACRGLCSCNITVGLTKGYDLGGCEGYTKEIEHCWRDRCPGKFRILYSAYYL